jgi:hypothetical protein
MPHDRAVTFENPSAEDYDSVRTAVGAMTAAGWRETTLNEAVGRWEQLVASVEDGYSMTVDDYTNDLAVREWLERVLAMLTPGMQASLARRLAPLDDRFLLATVEPKHRMPGAGSEWWYRLPKVLVAELAEDAERYDLAP